MPKALLTAALAASVLALLPQAASARFMAGAAQVREASTAPLIEVRHRRHYRYRGAYVVRFRPRRAYYVSPYRYVRPYRHRRVFVVY